MQRGHFLKILARNPSYLHRCETRPSCCPAYRFQKGREQISRNYRDQSAQTSVIYRPIGLTLCHTQHTRHWRYHIKTIDDTFAGFAYTTSNENAVKVNLPDRSLCYISFFIGNTPFSAQRFFALLYYVFIILK